MTWSYHRSVTIDHTKCGAADSSNFPVLFNSTDATLKTAANGGHVQNANGYDIAFFSDAGLTTALAFEIDHYDGAAGQYIAWVKVPTVSHSADTVIYIAYGDAAISTSQENVSGTWDASFLGVYHLKDGATLSATDSTSNANNGTLVNTPTAGSGKIDGAASFASASSEKISLPTTMHPAALTMEAWVNATTLPGAYNAVLSRNDNGGHYWQILVKSSGKLAVYLDAVGAVSYDGSGSNTLATATWTSLAAAYDSTNGLKGYFNGAGDGTASANGALDTTAAITEIASDHSSRYWNGLIDEVRISNVARSADWLLTTYNSQSSPSTFYALGSEISGGGTHNNQSALGSTSPVATLIRQTGKALSGTTSPVASSIRATTKTLSGATSPLASLIAIKVAIVVLAASATAVASLVRQTGKALSGNASAAASLVRSTARTLAASASPLASLAANTVKVTVVALAASATAVASLTALSGLKLRAFARAVLALPKPAAQYDGENEAQLRAALVREDARNMKVGQDVDVGAAKLILTAPDGSRWTLSVASDGTMTARRLLT